MNDSKTVVEDLAAWLTQIWDEEERLATEASPSPWHLNDEHSEVLAVDDVEVCTAFALSNNQLRWTARHIAYHDPASVLARVAADRKILVACERVYRAKDREYGDGSHDLADEVLELLASPYADRPGFRPEWSVERQGVEW